MNSTELKTFRQLAKKAREQRNATTNNEEFDYWQGIMEHYENKLKTGETND
jgi:lipid II:glycine glycyltransferase (peptidoglycan interpeptide bridge formation enzyme)